MSPQAIAGWATLALVVAVFLVVLVGSILLALRLRRIGRRLDHPLVRRIAQTAAEIGGRLTAIGEAEESLSQRVDRMGEELREVAVQRARCKRQLSTALAGIATDLRTMRDLLR